MYSQIIRSKTLALATIIALLIPMAGPQQGWAAPALDTLVEPGAKYLSPLTPSLAADEPPAPLPRDCAGLTVPGEDPPACCVYGYVYLGDTPVNGASVKIESPSGMLTTATAYGGFSDQPYFSADLYAAPLSASPGEVITLTVSHNDMVSIRSWKVLSSGQQVDLGLISGYQATGPVLTPVLHGEDWAAITPLATTSTDVGGPITEDTTWDLAGSPYIAISSVLVQAGVTLTIDPGVEVRFAGNYALQIDGQLIARGDSLNPITFTAHTTPYWSYIMFSDSSVDAVYDVGGNYVSGSILEYAVVEYAGGASIPDNGALILIKAHPFINHATIRNNQATGIRTKNLSNTLRIANSQISNNSSSDFGGGVYFHLGEAIISGSTIANNTATEGGGAIYTNGGTFTISNSELRDNSANNGGGIYTIANSSSYDTVVYVSDVTLINNTADKGAGIYVDALNYSCTASLNVADTKILNNSATNEGGGIFTHAGTDSTMSTPITVTNTIIAGNNATIGGGVYSNAFHSGTTINLNNNVIGANTASSSGGGLYLYRPAGTVTISGSAIVGNSAPDAALIIDGDLTRSSNLVFPQNTLSANRSTGAGSTYALYLHDASASLNNSNIFSNVATYELWNDNSFGSPDINAENNWWGTTSSTEISTKIHDWYDDSAFGIVDFNPYLTSPDTNAPIAPPSGLQASSNGTSLSLSWSQNPESDRAGYKVYYDSDQAGYPYEGSGATEGDSPVDVGNVTSFSLSGLAAGTYHVSVTAYDLEADGSDDFTEGHESWFAQDGDVSIYGPPQADFNATPVSGYVPLSVDVSDMSTGVIDAWSWDFGDGGTSDVQNPSHIYTSAGTYTVTLTVDGPGGSDSEIKNSYITVGYQTPIADFSATPLSGSVPMTVTFTDLSSGSIVAWDWSFGDGGLSAARHPEYVYTKTGTYSVSLSVSGPADSDILTRTDYVSVQPEGSYPPITTIDSITPDPAIQGQDLVYFNGSAYDSDESGAYMVAYEWISNLDGQLSTLEDFTVQAAGLSTGLHAISFRAQDNEGVWSLPATGSLTIQAPQGEVRTLILVNRNKLTSLYNASAVDQVMDKLDQLAAHENVQGLVVRVESDPAVAAAYTSWAADPTSTPKANAVTEAIKNLVDTHWTAHPDLEYLVIVGDDRALPFRRVLDQTFYPESYYSLVSPSSTTGAAFQDDMTLTDDFYADAVATVPDTYGWDGHDLYVPDLGSGRLVETPTEIIDQINTFLADDGVSVGDASVTGYDFLQDGAQAVCNSLHNDTIPTGCTLIGDSWTASQFTTEVLDASNELVSFNGHADHFTVGTPSGAILSSDILAAGADLTRALFFTIGCHSGLNVPPTNPYQSLDTTQAFIQRNANYIANTGYGWGYVTSIGLSEQLMIYFSERLVYAQSTTLGQALTAAKHDYYLNDGYFDYFDEKILIESTLYGLPMYRYSTPAPLTTASQDNLEIEEKATYQSQVSTLNNGLTINSLSYQFPAPLPESTANGSFYIFGGQVHTGHNEPIQPKHTIDVSFPGTSAHGVVFKNAVYSEVPSFDPVIEQAFTQTIPLGEPTFNAPNWYPPLLQQLNNLDRGSKVVAVLGQFNSQIQTERVYDQLAFDVYYHTDSNDWTPPVITGVSSELKNGDVSVTVLTKDSSGIKTVVIAYTDGLGSWESAALTLQNGSWKGTFPAGAPTEFLVQVVDNAGNVAVDENHGQYYHPGESSLWLFLPLTLR